ncbi:MAG: hypothetical protein E7401_05325 [Ruminococcaceae bacterium]|nr:hypothetical protein [Oscillospiraceae bacterium]
MKKTLSIAFVYIGLVIGAGFASGREIFEYFNLASRTDFTGIIFASLGFAAIAYITMSLAKRYSAATFDGLLTRLSGKLARPVKIFMHTFMFCGFFIMLSASGVLFKSTAGLSPRFGIFLLAALCFAVFVFDLKGIVAVNTILVPLMIAGMLYLCITSILFDAKPVSSLYNSVRRNFLVSAVCYVSYNTITAGAVLVPLAASSQRRELIHASAIAGAVLGGLIFLVWTALNIYYDAIFSSEMPLLSLAAVHGELSRWVYTAVLFMALCTTAISQGFGILSKFHLEKTADRALAAAILCLGASPFAGFGFSDLVSQLYSAFGFAGLGWTAILIYKYIKRK